MELIQRIEKAAPIEWFVSLTFHDAIHPEQADKIFARWLRGINEDLYGRRYREKSLGCYAIRATEYQRRGVLHFHALMGAGVKKLRRLSWMDAWEDMGGGFARIAPYEGNGGAVRYCVKYTTKGGDIDLYLPARLRSVLCGGLLQQELGVRRG